MSRSPILVALALAALVTACAPTPPTGTVGPPLSSPSAPTAEPSAEPPLELVTEAAADGTDFGLLSAVRLAGQDDTDRIVFEFADAVPGYRITYVDVPVLSDPAEQEVPLPGATAALQISMIGASAYAEVGDTEPAFPVPTTVTAADAQQVTGLAAAGDFERVLVWAAGVRERTGFQVLTLADPPRLVIDVAR